MVNIDANLKKALRKYAKVVLQYLADNAPEYYNLSDLLSRHIPGLIVFEDREENVPLYQIPEAKIFKKEMKSHPIVGKHLDILLGTEIGASRIDAWTVFRKFLYTMIQMQRNFVYDTKVFEKVFKKMISFFKSDMITIQFVAMLENFNFFEDKKITLQNGWRLERISKMKVNELVGISGYEQFLPHHVYETRYALINEFDLKKIISKDGGGSEKTLNVFNQINDEIETIMTAFRMIKRGRIARRVTGREVLGWHPFGIRTTSRDLGVPFEPGPSYTFAEEDVERLNEMLDLLFYTKSDDVLKIPLRRLRFATERRHAIPEDRILDVMIAFDSLFGADREMSYRLSLRSAMFLGESSEERFQLKNDFVMAYNLRSRIIHGNNPRHVKRVLKDWGLTLEEAADKLEDILRNAIVKYMRILKSGKTHEEIIQTLEDMILNDGSRSLL